MDRADGELQVYSEIFRVLKPGGKFAMYEWCLTDKFDPASKAHQDIRHGVEACAPRAAPLRA